MPMKLSEKEVLAMVQREWDRKVEALKSKYGNYIKSEIPEEKPKKKKSKKSSSKEPKKSSIDLEPELMSSGTRIKHKHSGIEYSVVSVSPRDVILKTPEGRPFQVDAEEIEKDYELD